MCNKHKSGNLCIDKLCWVNFIVCSWSFFNLKDLYFSETSDPTIFYFLCNNFRTFAYATAVNTHDIILKTHSFTILTALWYSIKNPSFLWYSLLTPCLHFPSLYFNIYSKRGDLLISAGTEYERSQSLPVYQKHRNKSGCETCNIWRNGNLLHAFVWMKRI